jgi:hypothetical protein
MTSVFVASGEVEAQQVRAFLEAEGIETMLTGEAARHAYGLTIDGLGAVTILVPDEDADAARVLLRSAEAGALRLPDQL